MMLRTCIASGVLTLGCASAFAVSGATSLHAQSSRATPRPRAFAEFEGVYDYQGGTRLALVANDSILFAIIDEAKYPLRPGGKDRFINGGGDTIPFRRNAKGVVTGFTERNVFFARRSAAVSTTLAEAIRAVPRPRSPNGAPFVYRYVAPVDLNDGLRVGRATDVGMDSAILARLVSRVVDGTYADVHSILAYKSGRLVVEEYFYGYDRARVHQMRSASKSIVSMLLGIAIDRGKVANDTARVMPLLPYRAYANADTAKSNLRLRDLLTMRSGFACDDWDNTSPGNESRVYQSPDWVKFVMDLPMRTAPASKGSYCSGNVLVIGRIIERATGMALPRFAQQALFTPLGVSAANVRWNYTLNASNAATFAQLYLRPRDMMKLGVLFHQGGKWGERQIISRDWVDRSTAKWSTVGDQEYGYFWWHQWVNAAFSSGTKRVDMVVATGNGGQKIFLVPAMDLVVVLTGGNYNANSPATAIMAKELLPAIGGTF